MRANPQRFSFNKIFSAYFNAAERRLIVRSVIIGALGMAFFSHYHTSTVQSLQGGDLLLLLGEDHLLDQFAADAMEIT
jgi:hypothetical protein